MREMIQILKDTISKVLEEMFFLITEENAGSSPIKELWYLDLARNDRLFCRINFVLDESLIMVMCENFLSKSLTDISEDEKESVGREFVNMVVGNMLEKIDPENEIKMGFPEEGKLSEMNDVPDIEMSFNSGMLRVYLDYEQE